MINEWNNAADRAINEMRAWSQRAVQIYHHNDTDGLTSGAILTRALERQGYEVRRYCLEKPYPAVLKKVFSQQGQLLIFADFAGRIAPLISDLNRGRNLTLILDHHVAKPATDAKVHNLDPDLFGLKGDRDISASTTCHLFAVRVDPANRDLAHIAALGAVADGFFVDGRLVSQNREVALGAVEQGTLEIHEREKGELYVLKGNRSISCVEMGEYLDILGGVGYHEQGPEVGVKVCLEGASQASDSLVEELKAIRTKAFDAEVARLRMGELKTSAHIQWFHVQKRFFPMGVKMIGAFCDAIRETSDIDPRKYIAGFQIIPDEIPGLGSFAFNQVKISMRVPPSMEGEIRTGKVRGLDALLPEATSRLGGFSDACHSLTAATTVPVGKEAELIEEMEDILEGDRNG